jgi:16S rRNA (uracil1498-N3)-methyltransferase
MIPHLYLPQPWGGELVSLSASARHHVEKVLRRRPGDPVTYTDGQGILGEGHLAEGGVDRGSERTVPVPSPRLTVAVAAPHRTERARFCVEKLAELGVDRLVWLAAEHGSRPPPSASKTAPWAVSAIQQSRGAHLLEIDGPMPLDAAPTPLWVAEPGAPPPHPPRGDVTVAVGPEGGFGRAEIPAGARELSRRSSAMIHTERIEMRALSHHRG